AGYVHVDLKPENVVLRDGRPYVVDLGSARPIGSEQPEKSPHIGSPGYAAPELEAGAPIAVTMDLYAVGAIAFEVLTGRPAFEPDQPSVARANPFAHVELDMP